MKLGRATPCELLPQPCHHLCLLSTVSCRRHRWCQDSARDYFDHGVRVTPGMTVLDAGANVGLFALEVMERLDGDANIFCFEPVPATCSLLRLNLARYPEACRPKVLNCGLSDEAAFVNFQVCPETNIISTAHPEVDPLAEVDSLVDFLRSSDAPDVYRRNFPGPFEIHFGALPRFLVKWVVQRQLKLMEEREEVVCELRTLHEVIASHSIGFIDLLKVDVEGAEEKVLLGLDKADWDRVQAAVIEVHDVDGRLERVRQLCLANGLSYVVVSHEPLFAAVKMRFRGGEEIQETDMLGVEGEESFHMATVTATRYPPDTSAVPEAANGPAKQRMKKKGGASRSPSPQKTRGDRRKRA